MFSWKPIYSEIANKLLTFADRNSELVTLLKKFDELGLKISNILDRVDESGTERLLSEIDPFTFLANFNRGITDTNRRAILSALKTEWHLQSPIPDDFTGLPVMNTMNSWFMPFEFKRRVEHVPKLWEFYKHVLLTNESGQLDTGLFDQCLKFQFVGLATLTMGMFWTQPEIWIALDSKNREFVKNQLAIVSKPSNGAEYIQWLAAVRNATELSPCQLSRSAHLVSISPSSEFASPFDKLFTDDAHANRVLDTFAQVLRTIDGSENDDRLACTVGPMGVSGARLSIIYGRWMVFRFECKGNQRKYEFLLDLDSPLIKTVEITFRYKRQIGGKSYVLVCVSEDDFAARSEVISKAIIAPLLAVKILFADWTSTPYASFHTFGLIDLALEPSTRKEILTQGLESSLYDIDFWLLAPGKNAVYWGDWKAENLGTIGWDEIGDLTQFGEKESIADAVSDLYPNDGPKSVASMLWEFSNDMKPGDVVFAKKGLFKVCGWGIVTGDYAFDDSRGEHFHTLPIDWRCTEELVMPEGVQLALKTLTCVSSKKSFLRDMTARYPGIPGLSADGAIQPSFPLLPTPPATYGKTQAMENLFLPEIKVDTIISLLRRKQNVVLQGAPGTGKTFVARRLAYLLMGAKDDTRVSMVQFHQSTTYEDFIQGYRPNGDNGFNLQAGSFYEFVRKAQESPDSEFVFVIDEINRGNLSKIFGELMMLIEADKRGENFSLPLTYAGSSQDKFFVPKNLYLIGTMNTADRSLSMVDYALRRRFAFIELEPGFDTPGFENCLIQAGASIAMVSEIRFRMGKLNSLIADDSVNLGRGYRIGHSFFVPQQDQPISESWLKEIIDFEIAPLLDEYWCDDPIQLAKARQIANGQS